MASTTSSPRCAMVLAHPGHELRLHHWVETHRPVVFLLTDGSGREGKSRLETTAKILRSTQSEQGSIFGRLTDRRLYQLALERDSATFCGLAEELADALVREGIETVVGDASEGMVMAHELWREVRLTAVEIAEQRLGHKIVHFEYPLDSHPLRATTPLQSYRACPLQEDAFVRKLDAAFRYSEVAMFVRAAITQFGEEAFRTEYLFTVEDAKLSKVPPNKCVFEKHGEQLVAEGVYPEVVRYGEHLLPIFESLQDLCSQQQQVA